MNVTVRFGGQLVLDRLNARIEPGSVAAIEGRSGSGKTTLMRCVLGLIKPDAGAVVGVPERVGAVFQEDLLLDRRTARGNVRLVCPKEITDARIDAHLREVGLGGDAGKRVRDFSGGMKRRVALVRALITGPDLLALDEPFKGLDMESKRLAAEYIARNRGSATVLIVTHDEAEAALVGATQTIRVGE